MDRQRHFRRRVTLALGLIDRGLRKSRSSAKLGFGTSQGDCALDNFFGAHNRIYNISFPSVNNKSLGVLDWSLG
jgi:hypothetical protein